MILIKALGKVRLVLRRDMSYEMRYFRSRITMSLDAWF